MLAITLDSGWEFEVVTNALFSEVRVMKARRFRDNHGLIRSELLVSVRDPKQDGADALVRIHDVREWGPSLRSDDHSEKMAMPHVEDGWELGGLSCGAPISNY